MGRRIRPAHGVTTDRHQAPHAAAARQLDAGSALGSPDAREPQYELVVLTDDGLVAASARMVLVEHHGVGLRSSRALPLSAVDRVLARRPSVLRRGVVVFATGEDGPEDGDPSVPFSRRRRSDYESLLTYLQRAGATVVQR